MLLSQVEANQSSESRFDRDTLARVAALAQNLQDRHQETLTAREMEAAGAEVGLAPEFMRQALAQVAAPKTTPVKPLVRGSARSRAYSKAWWASVWTLPFILPFLISILIFRFDPDEPSDIRIGIAFILFLIGWGIYFAGGILLSQPRPEKQGPSVPPDTSLAPVSRLAMLETVFALQRELQGQKRFAAFLSVDVVGSTEMKRGSDELALEYSFKQFTARVAEVVGECGGEVQSAAGDGMMARFPSDSLAVRAARLLQEGLPAFNARFNRLPLPFRIRCGVSSGQVPLEEGVPTGYVHSAVIDRAAALQKQAAPGDVMVSHEVAAAAITELGSLSQVPGPNGSEPAFSWRNQTSKERTS